MSHVETHHAFIQPHLRRAHRCYPRPEGCPLRLGGVRHACRARHTAVPPGAHRGRAGHPELGARPGADGGQVVLVHGGRHPPHTSQLDRDLHLRGRTVARRGAHGHHESEEGAIRRNRRGWDEDARIAPEGVVHPRIRPLHGLAGGRRGEDPETILPRVFHAMPATARSASLSRLAR